MAVLTGPIFKLAFGGSMAGGDEWSCSLILAGEVATPSMEGSAEEYKVPILAWFLRATSSTQHGATLEYVKFNQINKSDGKYTSAGMSDTYVLSPAGVSTAAATGAVPNQNTQAVTLHSELSRGRGSKGRFYPPNSSNQNGTTWIGADGRADATFTLSLATSAATMLNAINAIAVNLSVVVWSQVGQSAHGVDRVSVGRVVDTQRRRRNSLDEDRQFAVAAIVGQAGV